MFQNICLALSVLNQISPPSQVIGGSYWWYKSNKSANFVIW